MRIRYTIVAATTLALLCTFLPAASQASGPMDGFNANNIISDANMYGDVADSMSEAEISAFLQEKGASCIRGKDGSACLKDAIFDTQTFPASQWCSDVFTGSSADTAASVISKAAKACRISPKVLIVLLQKEQGLITTTNPTARAYARATGFACPDTAPCDPSKAGFATQVYAAASRLQQYKAQPHRFNFAVGRTTKIGYHPNAICGFTTVTPTNAATAAVYNYTPYVPNEAALANPYGAGDSCSAYGNRNFYRIHKDWFGQPNAAQPPESDSSQPDPQLPPTLQPVPAPQTRETVLAGQVKSQPNDVTADGNADFFTPANEVAPNGFGWGNGGEMAVGELSLTRTFTQKSYPAIGSGWDPSRTIDGGDWDNDGYPDLMLIREDGTLWLYPMSADFSWKVPRQIGRGWNSMDVVIGGSDFDGDHRSDLLARLHATGELFLYRGKGDGTFGRVQRVGVGWNIFSSIALIPSWQNGHPALAAVDAKNGRLHVYTTNGSASWGQRYDLGYGWNTFVAINGTRDVTGDGRGDLLSVTKGGKLRIYATVGNSFGVNSSQETGIASAGILPGGAQYRNHRFILGENGRIYAVSARPQLSQDQPALTRTGIFAKDDEKLFNVGDWNGDGLNDIIKWNSANEMILHAGTDQGRWDTKGQRIGTGWIFNEVIVANGWASEAPHALLAWNKKSGTLRLYTADARGNWGKVHTVGTGLTWADTITDAANWSGDSRPQIFAREAGSGRLMWIGADSYGMNVERAQAIGRGWNSLKDFYGTSDIDTDGRSDIVTRRQDGTLALYSGTGQLGFGTVRPLYVR